MVPARNRGSSRENQRPTRLKATTWASLGWACTRSSLVLTTITCDTAQALRTWVDSAMRPAFGKREVVELRIAAHYICRPRNNKKGNKISEHGRGKALDIGGFVFSDGSEWSIARDYNAQIRKAHKGACGIFGTTLGPGSDGYHEDHLHFDTARYNSGTYCR